MAWLIKLMFGELEHPDAKDMPWTQNWRKANMNGIHPENPVEPKVSVPIDASGSGTAVIIRNMVLQFIGFTGLVIGMFGFSDASMVVKLYKLASSEQFLPILGMASGLAAGGYQLYRSYRKHQQVQTLSLLPSTPNEVAIGPSRPTAAVERAVEAAIEAENRFG